MPFFEDYLVLKSKGGGVSSSLLDISHEVASRGSGEVLSVPHTGRLLSDEVEAALVAIVDDEALVRRSLERLVKSAGYRGESFASAEDFLEFGDRGKTDCLILDLMLPGMSGLELQQQLQDKGWHIPIVFVSARDRQQERTQALERGAITYLVKPFDGKVLLDAVQSAVK
jgi:FixJ family two-component response regulator